MFNSTFDNVEIEIYFISYILINILNYLKPLKNFISQ